MLMAVALNVDAKREKKAEPEILYGVKSGIITMSMGDMGGFGGFGALGGGDAIAQKIYFDDYGRRTVTESIMAETTTRSIVVGDETLMINDTDSTIVKMPVMGAMRGMSGTPKPIDWLNLDAKTIKKNKIKEIGDETVAGIPCKVYTMRINMMGSFQTQTLWIYKGITMKTETQTDWGTMGQSAIAFQENAEIPASKFEVPTNYQVREMQMGGFGGGFGGDFGGFGGDFGGFGGFGGGFGGF